MIEINPENQISPNNVFEHKLNALVLGVGGAGGKIVNGLNILCWILMSRV
jgi:cell division GTPase FtsZ